MYREIQRFDDILTSLQEARSAEEPGPRNCVAMSDSLGLATLSRERSDTGSVSSGASDRASSSRGGSCTSTDSTLRLAEHREQEKEVASRNPVPAARFDLISQRFLHMFASLCARLLFCARLHMWGGIVCA